MYWCCSDHCQHHPVITKQLNAQCPISGYRSHRRVILIGLVFLFHLGIKTLRFIFYQGEIMKIINAIHRQPSFITHRPSTQQEKKSRCISATTPATNETKSTQNLVSRLIDEMPCSCMRCMEMQTKLDLTYGLHLPINRGYKQQVLTLCCLQIHAMNRSRPSPYPP